MTKYDKKYNKSHKNFMEKVAVSSAWNEIAKTLENQLVTEIFT